MKKKLILIGAGGFAKSVIDSIDEKKYSIEGFIDNIKSGSHLGYKIFANNYYNTMILYNYYPWVLVVFVVILIVVIGILKIFYIKNSTN